MEQARTPIEAIADKQLYVFDMDGTIYLGSVVFDFAIRFIQHLRASGRRVLFFTNNASRSTAAYVEKLDRLGFSPRPEEIMSSADVTVAYLKAYHPGKTVYLVGTQELTEHFLKAGIQLVDVSSEKADIVISSFDTEVTYEKLSAACRLIRSGALYLSTHPDFNCPTEKGPIPDSGAIAAFIMAATGVSPRYLGKPYPEVVEMIERATGVPREATCLFGDRLYTDIALGAHNGVMTVLVLTGEGTREEAEALPEADRPTYIFPSLAEVDAGMFGTMSGD